MSIKQTIKYLLGWVQCARFGVADCGKGVYVGLGVKVDGGRRVHLSDHSCLMPSSMVVAHAGGHVYLGSHSEIGMYSRVASVGEVHIGDDVITGPHVFIADYNHEYADPELPIRLQGNRIVKTSDFPRGGVSIGDGSWIGTNAVIAGSVKVGKHCVIGANSVVTKDIPDYSVAVGSPARVVKCYDGELCQWVDVAARGR